MFTYEFSTTITEDGTIIMPSGYGQKLPKGEPIRVILVVGRAKTLQPDLPREILPLSSLEELIAEIKRTPPDPANFMPGDGLLAERLANPVTQPDPAFDLAEWQREWAAIEAEMEVMSLASEAEEAKALAI